MIDIEEIKKCFSEEYPDAAKAMKKDVPSDKAVGLAMYHAFKRGYINGYNLAANRLTK